MKGNRSKSIFRRLVSRKAHADVSDLKGGIPDRASVLQQQLNASSPPLTGDDLEQAYRQLLVENQILRENNQQLGNTLERENVAKDGLDTAEQLIRAQRNALAERSHRMREIEYAYKNLLREQKKQAETNRQLRAQLERLVKEAQALRRQHDATVTELKDARALLDDRNDELARMTERYFQLEAAIEKFSVPHGSVVNG